MTEQEQKIIDIYNQAKQNSKEFFEYRQKLERIYAKVDKLKEEAKPLQERLQELESKGMSTWGDMHKFMMEDLESNKVQSHSDQMIDIMNKEKEEGK